MAVLSLSLLGPFSAAIDTQPITSFPTLKSQALLAYLAVEHQAAHRREHLFTLLWPGMPEPSGRHNLRQTLYQLGQLFPDLSEQAGNSPISLLLADRSRVRLNREAPVSADIHRFDGLLEETRFHDHHSLTRCPDCRSRLQAAVELYRGEFLADFFLDDSNPFEDWATANREAYRRRVLDALETLAALALDGAEYEQARQVSERQLALEPLRESAHRGVMEALARGGRRRAALAHFAAYREQLSDELQIDPAPETVRLFEAIRLNQLEPDTAADRISGVPSAARSLRRRHGPDAGDPEPAKIRHNLPDQPTPFIGRKEELAELDALLADPETRLVTILGPGGMGKSRLALAAAERALDGGQFSDGVRFIDLAPLNEAEQLPLAIAEALDVQLSGEGGGPKQQLLDFLSDKTILFILDNCEHLLQTAPWVSEILAAAPGVQALATSRERLHLRAEQLYPILGLDVPDREAPEQAGQHAAARLFLQAARRLRPDFKPGEGDLEHLAQICCLLDGMPLALELAAGWVELLSLAEIAAELGRGLEILETGFQDAPDRQRSMQAVFESTWERLDAAERDLLQKLAVFRGGFTREAAAEVVWDGDESGSTLRLLGRLADKSLIQPDPARRRYQVHELLRQYAVERLERSGEAEATGTAHAGYYLQLLHRQGKEIKAGDQKNTLDVIAADFANIRHAWTWALARGNLQALDRTLEALYWFCEFRNREMEGAALYLQLEHHFAAVPDRLAIPIWRKAAARRMVLDQLGWMGDRYGKGQDIEDILAAARQDGDAAEIAFALRTKAKLQDPHEALSAASSILQESLSLYRRIGDHFAEYRLLGQISWIYLERGQPQTRVEYLRRQFEMARENGDRLTAADAQAALGFVDEIGGGYSQAEAAYRQALPVFREHSDPWHLSEYHIRLAELNFLKGDLEWAREWIRKGEGLIKQLPEPVVQSAGMTFYSNCTLSMILNAEERYRQAAQLISDYSFSRHYTASLSRYLLERGLAYSMCGLQDFEAAADHLSLAFEKAAFVQATGWQVQLLPAAALIAAGESRLERAAELLSLAFHHPAAATGWLAVFPLVTRLRERLRAELPEEILAEAWERGKTLDLEDFVSEFLSKDESE